MNESNRLATPSPSDIAAAAERVAEAFASGVPCAPVRDLIGRDDLGAAYAVQAALTERRLAAGASIVGRKIGLTSEAVQQQLGVDQPDFGVLFDDMAYAEGDTIPFEQVLQPRAEAEIAFVLGADLADGPLDREQVRAAIAYGVPALEICGSRIAGWDISFGDTVADNASAGAYVLGAERLELDEFDPVAVAMSMTVNGEEVSTGSGAACLGDPVEAVVWLARTARELGEPLRAGQVVLSGALGPMRPVAAGDTVTATLSGLGAVTVRFSEGAA
ncbi:2-keto-4-pentenoate hydratase [Streptomyces brasiliensis]|uniref:Hydratase/decarboxylase n=1 Tax=Streptomyces brasiliensis TaxID=1954 RepID=A0A917K2J4_9ACTN|nr:fumarylacetoacetate hydrolase family protein [Streptomyces brasiliensis]GGI98395.1 putative hydratase/decarboxylase [Streptomyces brasiliensis]